MKVVGFVEGARRDAGGIGLIGVPLIHNALARCGHHDLLIIAGKPMPTADGLLCEDCDTLWRTKDPRSAGVACYSSVGRWSFAPALIPAVAKYVRDADFITLHSRTRFPFSSGMRLRNGSENRLACGRTGFLPFQRSVSRRKKASYSWLIARRMLDEASVLFYSAEGERQETEPLKLRARSVVIPHGVDTMMYARLPSRGRFRRDYLGDHSGPVILYLGRLNAKKGIDLLIEAFAQVRSKRPDAILVIAGGCDPPSFGEAVSNWVKNYRLDGAAFCVGRLTEETKLEALADSDVFVLPSQAENFGFAMFEAMAAGLPVVVSNTLNYGSEVACNNAGFVVNRNREEFAAAILSLLGSPELGRLMGRNGQRLASAYSWETCGARVEAAITCAINGSDFPQDLLPN